MTTSTPDAVRRRRWRGRTELARLARSRDSVADSDESDDWLTGGALPPAEPAADDATGVDAAVPRGLRLAAAWSWRLLLVGAVIAVVLAIASYLSAIVFPLLAAFLLTAALEPLNRWLVGKRWPDWAAALLCVLFFLIVVGGLLTLVTAQIAAQATELGTQLVAGFRQLMDWLAVGPLHISSDQITSWFNQLLKVLQDQSSTIASVLASAGGSIGTFLTGLIMCLFALFFFLKDGRRFARSAIGWVPADARVRVAPAALAGWRSMVSYVKAVVVVAAVDGAGAGLGALLLGSNLWVAIMALTFVCAFVPMLGAMIAGGVGVIVVLATLGWIKALIMLAVFIVVLEGEVHIMQPLLLGRAVNIHPLVVLVSIAIGLVVAGIPGGVFAIPLVALVNGVIQEIGRGGRRTADAAPAAAGGG